MSKFDETKQRFLGQGISEQNIDYAIDSVQYGSKREVILENLTADYRGLTRDQAVPLVEALFIANGGEFKKENRGGYLYGGAALAGGLLLLFYIGYVLIFGGVLFRPVGVVALMIVLIAIGIKLLLKAARGKYRDADEPFKG